MTSIAVTLEKTLKDHGTTVVHIETRRGAAVDLHVFTLAAGVKVSKVVNLARDLAVAIGVDEVRIQAPIPGTPYIGIEAPAAERTTLDYHDFVAPGNAFSRQAGALPFPVGQQVGNGLIWGDLAKLPHLLIAGTTGSGKSVAINTLICSLLDHRNAEEVRLHLIDPKRVELVPFAGAPQVESFATDVDEALEVLADLEAEMDRRYSLFEADGVRNLDEYNTLARAIPAARSMLPRHVVIIDELADLIQANKVEVERVVARLGAVARAAGIHMVLATQRPSVNVVTGIIKGNVPSRWAFTVAAGVDSKVILDSTGAEALYGEGDSLWSPVGSTKPLRVQAVWTSAAEVTRAVESSIERHADQAIEPTLNTAAAEDSDDVEIEGLSDDVPNEMPPSLLAAKIRLDEARIDPMEDAVRENLGGLEPAASEDAHRFVQVRRNPRVRDRSELWLEPVPARIEPDNAALLADVHRATDAVAAAANASVKADTTRRWRNLLICVAAIVVVVVEVVRAVLG